MEKPVVFNVVKAIDRINELEAKVFEQEEEIQRLRLLAKENETLNILLNDLRERFNLKE